MLQVWIQDNDHGKRVNANLKAVQFYEHGEAFSTSAPIARGDAFTDIEEDQGEDIGGGSRHQSMDDDDDSVI
jgi:hypothetical protein